MPILHSKNWSSIIESVISRSDITMFVTRHLVYSLCNVRKRNIHAFRYCNFSDELDFSNSYIYSALTQDRMLIASYLSRIMKCRLYFYFAVIGIITTRHNVFLFLYPVLGHISSIDIRIKAKFLTKRGFWNSVLNVRTMRYRKRFFVLFYWFFVLSLVGSLPPFGLHLLPAVALDLIYSFLYIY